MLKAVNRLKKETDFALVLSTGERRKIGPLLFFSLKTDQPIRIGVIVSKKVDKKAVVRNHLRRLLSSELGQVIATKSLTNDIAIVVLYTGPEMVGQIKKAVDQWVKSL